MNLREQRTRHLQLAVDAAWVGDRSRAEYHRAQACAIADQIDAEGDDEMTGCGYEYDHDVNVIHEGDDGVQLQCRVCGAEWVEDGE